MADCDAIVVGGGRAGSAVAAALKQRGVSVTVLEKTPYARPSRLVTASGSVTGVALDHGRIFGARHAVVLATGGYESDPVLTRRFEDIPGLRSAFSPNATGDGLRMAAAIGARVHLERNNLNVKLGYRHAGSFVASDSIVVNRFGRRIGIDRELAPALRAFDGLTRSFTNLPCWQIVDRIDENAVPVENTIIDAAGLAATLEGTALVPPLYAIELHPSITSSAGLAADNDGRVLNWRGQAIPGLYAIGRVAAPYRANDVEAVASRAAHDIAGRVS